MSRRKQLNPNKVKLMEGAIDEQREGGGASTEVNDTEAELTEENTHNNLKGTSNGVMEGEEEELNGDRVGGGAESEGGGGDLSSINAMMSAVMSAAGTINGGGAGVDPAHTPSSGPSPSPSPNKSVGTPTRTPTASRNARRNQETTTTKDDGKEFICPLCDKNCMTQHNLTMHIRQHNADAGATDHSCSICGKALSSASSLDRHMLVHSGERPYKCNNCGQTFTTNGNMHRHMKIHEKDPSTVSLSFTPPSPTKRRRPSAKRRLEEEKEEPPSKKVPEESVVEEKSPVQPQKIEEYVRCPICFQTCTSRHDLDAHMDTHPDTTLRCDLCCVSFRTHRGLLRHNAAVHKLLPQDPMGRPFIQNNPSIPNGFNDLAFIDFSCNKFAHIAQVWCETNLRRCVSRFHRFVCDSCDKAFPLQSALDLHTAVAHPDQPAGVAAGEKAAEKLVETAAAQSHSLSAKQEVLPPQQSSFLESLGLQHVSKVKLGPSEDQIRQSQLDSIKVIHVEPSSCAFPQEPASAYLSLGLGVGVGGLGALGGLGGLSLGIPIIEAAAASASGKTTTTLQGLSQRDALSLLSLQPFQASFLVQHPDGGASAASSGVKPGEGIGGGGGGAGSIMELADIQQILKVAAAAAPNQMGLLPPLAKAPGYVIGGQGQVQSQKSMPPLKPKPPLTPRSSLTAHTPPPLQSSQQASLGCISPSLPPPTPTLFKIPSSSSSSSSSSGSGGSQMEGMECMGDVAHTPSSGSPSAQEEAGLGGKKSGGGKGGGGGGVSANGGSAKGSFPCRFCEQVFPFSGVLQAHMRFHLGVLPHQCNICDYVAPDKATLIRHLRTHSGERPYVCRVCHYPFTVKANCERHLRKKHAKTSRKEIEKNIKYVTSAATMGAITQDGPGLETSGTTGSETVCRFCGDDLKTYRALQIHLRTHNGCQKKPFECRRCGAAFLAKRNCIHHLLKQHPEVQEKEIEDHIATLLPAAAAPAPPAAITVATAAAAVPVVAAATSAHSSPACLPVALTNGLNATQSLHHQIKVEESLVYSATTDLDQPLDFSAKGRRVGGVGMLPGVKLEELSPGFQCLDPDQPIDLSIPSKRQRREAEGGTGSVEKEMKIKIKMEPGSASSTEPPPQQQPQQQQQQPHHGLGLTKVLQVEERNASILPPLHPHPQPGCYQLPPGSTPPTPACLSGLQNNPARALRLKPLLPKPASSSSSSSTYASSAVVSSIVSSSSSSSSLKELPPLASIAQIISSVSGVPELLKTREAGSLDGKAPQGGLATSSSQADSVVVPEVPGTTASPDTQTEETKPRPARKRSRKRARAAKEKAVVVNSNNTGSGIDLESSGEFASVERMLATTDSNKFSTYLQTGAADLGTKRHPDRHGGVEEAGGEDGKPTVLMPQSKGKKNAYSNSVQKMTCPFCPRVFPWASSLQRHMLTHTGQKPYPCPNCDAFFSTKSNCERHLLRKHGVTNRSMRRNGSLKKDGEDGSHDSGDSQSDSEQANPEAVDLSGSAIESRSTLDLRRSSDSPRAVHVGRVTRSSPASRPSQGASPSPSFTDESGTDSSVIMDHLQGAAENKAAQPPQNNCKMDADEDDEDSQSNKSLDLNFASKLIDFTSSFTFSSSTPAPTCSAADQRPSHTSVAAAASALPPPPPTAPGAASQSTGGEEKEKPSALASLTPAVKPAPEYKHVCRVCKKSFRYATTLARHERAHLSEETPAPPPVAAATTTTAAASAAAAADEEVSEKAEERNAAPKDEENKTSKAVEAEEQDGEETTEREAKGGESEGGGESGESEDEDEEEEKERSDDEGGASEPKKEEGGEGGESRVDKRKKICNVCGKRFWSMQDLTRHMRSHTGERPYQCQTCERTFTLKHSLVRHQRIHLKPRGDPGMSSAPSSTGCHDDGSEDGDLSCTPTSTCPPSENESEGGGGGVGGEGKELDDGEEEEEEEEEENDQESSKEAETRKPKPSVDQSQVSSGSVPAEAGLESPAAEGSTSEPGSESTPGSSFGSESSPPEPRSDEPAEPTAESETAPRKATATETPGERQASDSTAAGPSSSSSKDPSSSSSHSSSSPGQAPVASAAPTEGFIQGLLEIRAQPHLEHILPGGEPPLVGVE